MLTSEEDWNPTVLDHELDNDDKWFAALEAVDANPYKPNFNCRGDYTKREIMFMNAMDSIPTDKVFMVNH